MGIVKIRHRGALNKNHAHQKSRTFKANELAKKDADDDLDDSDLSDTGCELAMLGDQICNIPYDLYDLSTLRDVLSLETWNYCLTEEERFSLAAHLPDMGNETFVITIKELLSGEDLFFGNPLEKLFRRLQGGFYSTQVIHVREGLGFLEKRKYYHCLRLYHEKMNEKYSDMRRAWSNCLSSTTIEERVRIWNKKKDPKPILLVDLNSFPEDEESLNNKGDKRAEEFPFLKKIKYMDEDLTPHCTPIDLNSAAMNKKPKGKGVLKVRPIETKSTTKHNMHTLLGESWEQTKRAPKGVLKIKPKSAMTMPIQPTPNLNGLLGIHGSRFSNACANSSDSDSFAPRGHQKWTPEEIARTTAYNTGEREIIFPITYKRKKGCTKLNPAHLEPIESNRAEFNLLGKAKSVKIKIKGWNSPAMLGANKNSSRGCSMDLFPHKQM